MAKQAPSPFPFPPQRVYWGADIPLRVIRRYARAIAEEFQPDQIILFGSHAYGTPHADSDVDLLVVMPTRNPSSQAVRIRWRLSAPFPLDLLVRTPKDVAWRLAEKESFLTTVVTQGIVLYEKDHPRLGRQGRRGPHTRRAGSSQQTARA
ncbi:MAG: nucleotidyltransferase domain-containing protein [Planctomycetia bacterium]|nr:nucleotidyltransferase domain-containing protein [Planctomycetia bacterium]